MYPNRNPAWKQALLIIDFQGNTRKGSSTSLSAASDLVQVYVGDILDGTALLYSLDGVLIVSQELKMGTAIFDVTTLASGTYIVKILSEVTVPRSIKIVLQH